MLCSSKDREDLEKLEGLVSLQNHVKVVGQQDKFGKQNFHEDMKRVFEPVTKSIKDVCEKVTKTITETASNNKRALQSLNNKLLEILIDRGLLATYLVSPLTESLILKILHNLNF